jgi:exodeoxyribonuclease V alpha subunit
LLVIGVDELRGGMKTYRGSATAARHYVEADCGRADDYYLAEGTGIAQRYTASPDTGVRRLAPLTCDGYEAWVAGFDPETGTAKGRLRNDEQAVRFVEVVVNGPKSWSLAAELHPDISRAYDAAQDCAATQIIAWLAEQATTRVGPRGAQVQVPVAEIEAVTVRHYTSRAGDPHRHLHLQINARVFAEGRWRGLHTVGIRDSLDAINGIGHAAVMTDPAFRAALAAHGFTLEPDSGEVVQLAEFVGRFSARAAQIGRNIDRYETEWRAANPGREPGPVLRRAWDARAWADARPDKVVPRRGAELTQRWVAELHALGYRDRSTRAQVDALPVGQLDRTRAVEEVLSRLTARRSGWNSADIRGEVEQLIARRNLVTDARLRIELAEDLTARALAECVPLLDRAGVPEHIRALTSPHVLDVEADLTGRLVARGNATSTALHQVQHDTLVGLDAAQRDVVTALSSDRQLVVVEGVAGAGKTTTFAATRAAVEHRGGRLVVVAPTLKAANVAAQQLDARASSAASFAYQHGFRWSDDGCWTRLTPGAIDPYTSAVFAGPGQNATLRVGDLLLVDEAGMLDQDTARALLTIADDHHARLALVGDRHQLPAVGRGGVLDLAARWADPEAYLTLDTVHRFTRTITVPDGTEVSVADQEYAQLSLAMRCGVDAGEVFDALLAREQLRVHSGDIERLTWLAKAGIQAMVAGSPAAVVADTREQVADLNAAIRERLVAAGRVDDERATTTNAGQRIGVGDRVATRRNNAQVGVANRDTWTVTQLGRGGDVTVTGQRGERTLPAEYVGDHLELAYASTVHGVQGETATCAHMAIGEYTSAASAYVGMTRGRTGNTAHLIADSIDEARGQWVAVFARDRADLGPAHAAELAAHDASRYAQLRPLEQALAELRQQWAVEQDCLDRLARDEQHRDLLGEIVPLRAARERELPPLEHAYRQARESARHAEQQALSAQRVLDDVTERIRDSLLAAWDQARDAVRGHAQTVREGGGRFGQRRPALARASGQLTAWADAWRPVVPDLPTTIDRLVDRVLWFEDRPRLWDTVDKAARGQAEHTHPDAVTAIDEADRAAHARRHAWRVYRDTDAHFDQALAHYGNLARTEQPAQLLARLEIDIAATGRRLEATQTTITALLAQPTLRALPAEQITAERDHWHIEYDVQGRERYARSAQPDAERAPPHQRHVYRSPVAPSTPDHWPGISR